MSSPTRRSYPRIRYQAPVHCASPEAGFHLDGHMFNFSREGMYLETRQRPPDDATIHIYMRDYAPGAYGPEAYQWYVANIRWRRDIDWDCPPRFGLGVRLLERRHADESETEMLVEKATCHLCGRLAEASDCRWNEDGLRFCNGCYKHMESLPDGKIRDCIHRFLMGNVI